MGGIDPNIVLRLQQPQFERPRIQTPLEQFQKVLTLKQLMQEGQLGELALRSKQEELDAYKGMGTLFPKPALTTATPAIGLQPPAAAQSISPDAYQEPNLMRPAGPEGRTPVTTTAFAPAGTAPAATTAFASAGTPSVSSGLSGFPSAEALIAKGGRFAFPFIENLNKARKAELDQHVSALDLEKKESEATARLVNGITDDASLKRGLAILANKGKITWDDVRRYSDLGFASPVTQNVLKQNQLQSLDYVQNVEVALKNAKEKRDAIEFENKQRDDEMAQAQQDVQTLTDVKEIPGWLAEQPKSVQARFGKLAGMQDLGKFQELVVKGTGKAEFGKTMASPEDVQAQEVAKAAAQGLASKQAELGFINAKNEAAIQGALKDPTGKTYANYPPEIQKEIAPELAKRGFTAFTSKPTDTQSRVLNFYERAKEAEDSILAVPQAVKGGPTPKSVEQLITEKNLWGQTQFHLAPNALQTPEGKLYWQALRQFTEARLRKESGASIQPYEYEESQRTYFPVPGDDKPTLDRKRTARQGLLESMKTEAGPAYTQKYPAKQATPQGSSQQSETPAAPPARTSTGAAQAAPPGSWQVQVTKPGGKPEPMWMGPDGRTYELPPEPTIDTTKPSPLKPVGRYNPKTGKIEAIR